MTQQIINIGSAPNSGTGDPLRTAFTKCNQNFSDLYTFLGAGTGIINAPSGNPAITITTPTYTFGNVIDNPSFNFNGNGSISLNGTGGIFCNGAMGCGSISVNASSDAGNGLSLIAANTLGFWAGSLSVARMGANAIASSITGTDTFARGIALCRFKTSATSRTSVSVLADPDLTIALPSGGTFAFEFTLIFGSTVGGATPGFFYQPSYTGSFGGSAYNVFGWANGAAYATGAVVVNVGQQTSCSASVTGNSITIIGTITATGSGTFSLNWGQGNTSATATVLSPASYMKITQLS